MDDESGFAVCGMSWGYGPVRMEMHMGRVENKVAIVTGGAKGLGRVVALRLAKEGAKVSIFDLTCCEEALADIVNAGAMADGYLVDITDSVAVSRAIQAVIEKQGSLDIMVNNAGVASSHEDLRTVTDELWDKEIAINLSGAFYCCRAAYAQMLKQKSGKIINIASIAGDTGRISTSPAYSAAKAGISGLTRSIAKNAAKHGINVNAISPGVVLTGIHDSYPKEDLDQLLSEIPYVRGGQPFDIANAVLFLAGSESDYITGVTLQVNGGSFMK